MPGGGGITAETGQQRRSHIRAKAPGRSAVNVAVVVGAIQPAQEAVVPASPVVGPLPELAHNDRVTARGYRHFGIPGAGPSRPLVGINVGRVNDAVPAWVREGVGGKPSQVVGPIKSPGHNHVVGAGSADGVQQALEPR